MEARSSASSEVACCSASALTTSRSVASPDASITSPSGSPQRAWAWSAVSRSPWLTTARPTRISPSRGRRASCAGVGKACVVLSQRSGLPAMTCPSQVTTAREVAATEMTLPSTARGKLRKAWDAP